MKTNMKAAGRLLGLLVVWFGLFPMAGNAQTVYKSLPLILGNHYANYFTYEELSNASHVIIRHDRTAHKYWKRSASLPVRLQVYEKNPILGGPSFPLGKPVWVENTPCRARVKVDLSGTSVEKWPEEGCFIAVEFMPLSWYQQHGFFTDSNYFYWEMSNIEGQGRRKMKTYVVPQWKCEPSEYVMYDLFDPKMWRPAMWDSQYRILKLK